MIAPKGFSPGPERPGQPHRNPPDRQLPSPTIRPSEEVADLLGLPSLIAARSPRLREKYLCIKLVSETHLK